MKSVVLVAFLLVASPLSAQTITGYSCRLTQQGLTTTVSTLSIPPSGVTCNQPAPVTTNTVNPTHVTWDDPAFPAAPDPAARSCIFNDAPVGPLSALPFSATIYTMVCVVLNSAGANSPDALPSNSFTRPGVAAPALTGVKVYR